MGRDRWREVEKRRHIGKRRREREYGEEGYICRESERRRGKERER